MREKKLTVSQAYKILIKRGFDKLPSTYKVYLSDGSTENEIASAHRSPTKMDGYIDCGPGFLFVEGNQFLHPGTEEYLSISKLPNNFKDLIKELNHG